MREKIPVQMVERMTINYYSRFCGTDLSQLEAGTCFLCTEERDETLKGFGCKYPVYVLVRENLCAASCSPRYSALIEPLKDLGPEELIAALCQRFPMKKKTLMLFEQETLTDFGEAKILEASDYPLYEKFFREAYPDASPEGWLGDYFLEKAEKGYFAGYLLDGRLVSVCDAPDMPYLEDAVQHTGIHTLPEERRKGYGARTAALAARHLLEKGVCPQWECGAENTASVELAKSIGYREYAAAYILEEWA